MTNDDCLAILGSARRNNTAAGITGLLIYAENGTFLQLIEGEEEKIDAIFNKIQKDARHDGLAVLYDKPSDSRSFPNWSMGFDLVSSQEMSAIEGFRSLSNKADLDRMLHEETRAIAVLRALTLANSRFL